jgi:competence protein ComFC
MQSNLWKVLDWVFPPECPGCKTMGTRWCSNCRNTILNIPEPICPFCGEPGKDQSICSDCLSFPPGFDSLRSATLFQGSIREALHQLKYNQDIGLGEVLAPHLVNTFLQQKWDVDLVTSVPLSRKRQRIRGYNQAEMLAKPFAALIRKPYSGKVIQRTIDTRSQIELNAEERRKNVTGAFYATAMFIDQKSVIIIDDVSTTGATISECASALKQAGAKKVFALTLARAPLKSE